VVTLTPCPSPPPLVEWPALTSVTHHDAVDSGPCIGLHLNNRPLLSLLLAKYASSTSPLKPPATYTYVTDFGPRTDSIFRGQLITRERLIREYYTIIDLFFVLFSVSCCGTAFMTWLVDVCKLQMHVDCDAVFESRWTPDIKPIVP